MTSPHREAVCRTYDTCSWLWQDPEPCSVPLEIHNIHSSGCLKLPRTMVGYSLDQGLALIPWQENRSLECHGGRSSTSHNSVGSYDRIVGSTVVHNLALGPILDRYRDTVCPAIDE